MMCGNEHLCNGWEFLWRQQFGEGRLTSATLRALIVLFAERSEGPCNYSILLLFIPVIA